MNQIFRAFADNFGAVSAIVAFLTLVAFVVVLGPWLLFWSIGVMSTAAGTPIIIPLTFKTWCAAIIFMMLVRGSSSSSSSK